MKKLPTICPVCKEGRDFKFIQDYKNKRGEWSLYQCLECEAQFWMPFKNPGADWYKNKSAKDILRTKLDAYYKQVLKSYKNLPKSAKVLDLGCGECRFINELQEKGYEVWGVDFDKNIIELARRYFNLKNVYAISFDEFFKLPNLPKFDIITFFDVIEHLDNPLEFIQNVSQLLKEGGMIILSTPSRNRILVNSLKFDFPPVHLIRWNEKAIVNLFKKINFRIIRINYIEPFRSILHTFSHRFSFGSVEKTIKSLGALKISKKGGFLIKIIHLGAYFKNYLLFGIPTVILFLISKLMNYKNGEMMIWLKREA